MATEQDHVWAMLDDMLLFLSKRHVPTPERTYKLDGGWTLAMDDLRRYADRLTAERDQLRAEAERLRKSGGALGQSAKHHYEAYEAAERERVDFVKLSQIQRLEIEKLTARAEAAERDFRALDALAGEKLGAAERERDEAQAQVADLRGALEALAWVERTGRW